jgi:hypothetical protein
MPAAQYRHFGCRITDDLLYKGMRTLFLENEIVRVGILLDKGADIFQLVHKPSDTDFLWCSPQGLIDPRRFTPTTTHPDGASLTPIMAAGRRSSLVGARLIIAVLPLGCTVKLPNLAGIMTFLKTRRNALWSKCRSTVCGRLSAWKKQYVLKKAAL